MEYNSGINAEKNSIRKRILESRSKLTREDICIKSGVICSRLLKQQEFVQARLVMCYMDFRSEVMTGEIITGCIKTGKRVVLPYVGKTNGISGELQAYEIKDLKSDVTEGAYGILEPDPGRTDRIDEKEIDLVIVPGVAFDLHKNRIGYGAGYYDRFLYRLRPVCVKAGIAFDIQIVDNVPVDENDIEMDLIITETRILY